ncbi:hypothetical protein ABIA35_001084 [Catenulispora sp. MAP12-49]|uniref:DUF3885 domain-containing protein n=1 Tax=Catenulispora sp. MAP12-49 TaxID=3156302 RepID=UPI0035147C65
MTHQPQFSRSTGSTDAPADPTNHAIDIAAFNDTWLRSWPGITPVAHPLRSRFPSRWVRFHSLPESKRYATSDAEHAEILHRHHTILAALTRHPAPESQRLVVITCSWSDTSRPVPRDSAVATAMPIADHWRSDDLATDPGFHSWQHHYASVTTLASTDLDRLLMTVADDMTGGVLIVGPGLNWLYHPYDGGADVIAESTDDRDRLATAFPDWRSPQPSGL